jgi:hypothetical protein
MWNLVYHLLRYWVTRKVLITGKTISSINNEIRGRRSHWNTLIHQIDCRSLRHAWIGLKIGVHSGKWLSLECAKVYPWIWNALARAMRARWMGRGMMLIEKLLIVLNSDCYIHLNHWLNQAWRRGRARYYWACPRRYSAWRIAMWIAIALSYYSLVNWHNVDWMRAKGNIASHLRSTLIHLVPWGHLTKDNLSSIHDKLFVWSYNVWLSHPLSSIARWQLLVTSSQLLIRSIVVAFKWRTIVSLQVHSFLLIYRVVKRLPLLQRIINH